MRLALLLAALVAVSAPRAQVAVDFNVGPTVAWTEDVSAFTFDPADPGAALRRDSLVVPATVGVQGGLGLTMRAGGLGIRVGGQFLNTTALYDGEERLNRQALDTSFLTLQLDLQFAQRVGPASVYVFGGPEARYLLDLSGDVAGLDDLREGAELLSAAANLGGGVRLNLFGTRVGPEVRYAFDLTGVSGQDVALGDGSTFRFDEAFDIDTLLVGLVIGGI